jgi:hypothetical protein
MTLFFSIFDFDYIPSTPFTFHILCIYGRNGSELRLREVEKKGERARERVRGREEERVILVKKRRFKKQ